MPSSTRYSVALLITILVIGLILGAYLIPPINTPNQNTTSESTQTTASYSTATESTSSPMLGVIVGYVTVGPSQPICQANQSCDVNLMGYSIVFGSKCSNGTCQATYNATISQNGHYSILLMEGNYTAIGLNPSCEWLGCTSAFPRNVVVVGGMQTEIDFNIDTGIR